MLRHAVWFALADVSEELNATMMIEAVISSETSARGHRATSHKTAIFILVAVRT
jgi:hypothetical protein